MKRTIVHAVFIAAVFAGLSALSACPPNTPQNPILSKLILGTWDLAGSPAQFNEDGSFSIDSFVFEGTYEIVGNAILLTQTGDPEARNMLIFQGLRNGNPMFAGPLPIAEFTRPAS